MSWLHIVPVTWVVVGLLAGLAFLVLGVRGPERPKNLPLRRSPPAPGLAAAFSKVTISSAPE